jgi:hypothetical protein
MAVRMQLGLALLWTAQLGSAPDATPGFGEMECQMHRLALRFADERQPSMPAAARQALIDALRITQLCGEPPPPLRPAGLAAARAARAAAAAAQAASGLVVYVAPHGADSNDGTDAAAPLRSLLAARDTIRAKRGVSERSLPSKAEPATVLLHEGKYFLNVTLELTAMDSWTTWRSMPGERAVLSGGTQLSSLLDWKPAPAHPRGVLVAELDNMTDALDPDYRQDLLAFNASGAGKMAPCCAPSGHSPTGCDSGCCPCPNRSHVWGVRPERFNSLFVNGKRQISARYPNGNPEDITGLCFSKTDWPEEGNSSAPSGAGRGCDSYWGGIEFGTGGSWGPSLPGGKKVGEASMGPDRGKSPTHGCPQCGGSNPVWPGQNFHYVVYEPPKGHPVFTPDSRSWGGLWGNSSYVSYYLDTLARPGGMKTNLEVSNASKRWAHPETGVMHTFQHAGWGGQTYRLVSRDNRSGSDTFTMGYGGYQEARGNDGNTFYNGDRYYVSGILEELDTAGEWYHDALERKLYYYPHPTSSSSSSNGASASAGAAFGTHNEVVAAQLSTVIRIGGAAGGLDPAASGTWSPPAVGIVLDNLTITETRATYLDRYEVPSGGDWAVARVAAVVLENAENATVRRCFFDQVGGNAVLLSNHVAHSTIEDSDFDHMGDSGVVSLGSAHWTYGIQPTFPISNTIARNVFRDVGIFGKQTSCYFQALSGRALFVDNVCFRGPRAGINFNDGFFGHSNVTGNTVLEMVRETHDHGPLNSWDRQPYITKNGVDDGFNVSLRGGPPGSSVIMARNYVTKNFIINGHAGMWTLDRDDGSQFVNDTGNVLMYGGCKQNSGNSQTCDHNLMLYPGMANRSAAGNTCLSANKFANSYYANNDCIADRFMGPVPEAAKTAEATYLGFSNRYYLPPADPQGCLVSHGNTSSVQSCPSGTLHGELTWSAFNSFANYSKYGNDDGSSVLPAPSLAQIVHMAEEKLGLLHANELAAAAPVKTDDEEDDIPHESQHDSAVGKTAQSNESPTLYTAEEQFAIGLRRTEERNGKTITTIAATDPLVQWSGRVTRHHSKGQVHFDWLGVTAHLTVSGCQYLAVIVNTTAQGRGTRMRVYIDDEGALFVEEGQFWVTNEPTNKHVLYAASPLDPGGLGPPRTITMVNQVPPEYQVFSTVVIGFETDGTFVNSSTGSPNWPYFRLFSERSIELIGDSITAATNVNRAPGSPGCGDMGLESSWGQSYSAYLCRYFGAQCSTIAVGGHCIMEECGFPQMADYFQAQSFYDPPDLLGTYNFSEHLATKRAPDAMVIHLGSNDYGHGGNWSSDNSSSAPATLGPGAQSFVRQLVALMLNATLSYRSKNITFFLPTGPMVNATMDATLAAVQQGRALGLNVHWIDMRRTCVGLVHQTHDDAQSFCEATKSCSYCDGCAGHPGLQGHFNMFAAAARTMSAQMGWDGWPKTPNWSGNHSQPPPMDQSWPPEHPGLC